MWFRRRVEKSCEYGIPLRVNFRALSKFNVAKLQSTFRLILFSGAFGYLRLLHGNFLD